MTSISLTRGTLYDVELDVDVEADRVDHVETEEVLAYVPAGCIHRQKVIAVLTNLAIDLNASNSDNSPATT